MFNFQNNAQFQAYQANQLNMHTDAQRNVTGSYSIKKADCLFQHLLTHLQNRDLVSQTSRAPSVNYTYQSQQSTPQKAGAFVRLPVPRKDMDSTICSSGRTTPRNSGSGASMLFRPIPVYMSASRAQSCISAEELKEDSPVFAGNASSSEDSHSNVSEKPNTIKVTRKPIQKQKKENLDAYKDKCKAKHEADKRKLASFNDKIANGTITQKEKQQRLNLIRQINSRNYRVQNKELVQKQQAFIDFTVKFAEENGIEEFMHEYRKFKETDDKELSGQDSDSESEF